MHDRFSPSSLHRPLGAYNHGAVASNGEQLVLTAGQVGMRPDGTMANGHEAQIEQAWDNIAVILEARGAGIETLLHVRGYVTEQAFAADYGRILRERTSDPRPASTLVVVKALASDDFLVEIEAVAAVRTSR